jgi:hypothetical protein
MYAARWRRICGTKTWRRGMGAGGRKEEEGGGGAGRGGGEPASGSPFLGRDAGAEHSQMRSCPLLSNQFLCLICSTKNNDISVQGA